MFHSAFFRNPKRLMAFCGLTLAFSIQLSSFADDSLSVLEQNLYSTIYAGESATQRLERLEASIFGEVQTGTELARTARLNTVLAKVHKPAPSTDTKPSSYQSTSTIGNAESFQAASPAREPDGTDYPTVTAIERQVFGRDFIRDDVSLRLDRLEKKVFGQPSPQTAMADRVDNLLSRYPQQPGQALSPANPTLQSLPSDSTQFTGSGRDVYTKLDALERHYLNGKSSPNSLITERLDRLEQQAYAKTFAGESVDRRVDRLLGQYEATPNTPAASTYSPVIRPGFQQRQPYQQPGSLPQVISPGGTPATARQNIQIGGGFSSTSSHSFSPELMSMLPPGVRSQMGAGTSSSGTVVRSPSTVIVERQSFGSPGFNTYGGAPIQQYNYYGPPGMQVSSQSTTTVIQPDGSQAVYGYPGAAMPGNSAMGNPNGLPNPAYVGNPAFLQSLNQLEINALGQVNQVEPVPIRLGKLETALLGQMYVGLPDQQRLENLEKAHRMHAVNKLLGQNKSAGMSRGVGGIFLGVPLSGPNPMNPMGMPINMPINPGLYGR